MKGLSICDLRFAIEIPTASDGVRAIQSQIGNRKLQMTENAPPRRRAAGTRGRRAALSLG
jgi:hypothetical protein